MSPRVAKKKTLQQQADKLCGDIVRARGACENCGRSDRVLQWAHGWSRSYKRLRHDERACFCLCINCHLHYTHRPIEWEEWMMARLGDEYDALRAEAINYNGPPVDLKETVARLKARWAEVEGAMA